MLVQSCLCGRERFYVEAMPLCWALRGSVGAGVNGPTPHYPTQQCTNYFAATHWPSDGGGVLLACICGTGTCTYRSYIMAGLVVIATMQHEHSHVVQKARCIRQGALAGPSKLASNGHMPPLPTHGSPSRLIRDRGARSAS